VNLFEFLMILLSLIVGLGIAETLSGVAGILKNDGIRGFSYVHGVVTVTLFLGLLQTFWESWGLAHIAVWTYPAMLLMLGAPVLLYLVARIMFPDAGQARSLEDHYFERARLIWVLVGLTVIVGTLFRPIAFGMPLLVLDNLSSIPMLLVCAILATVRTPIVHRLFATLILAAVVLDTLTISYTIR